MLANDRLTQLAFSIYENKGVFAVLIGSGVSRAAEIPTGWEITLDLVRRVALAQGNGEQSDWANWYRENYGREPSYSSLIEEIGTSADQRRSILQSYIEPTEQDREEHRKVPTMAHIAIAELVKAGFIKVIVTTNFDRLMENALRESGVEPTIVASTDALTGAEPIAHSSCYLVKLHGDYKDSRILNTEGELAGYSDAFNRLLDRIFDEYGLIVAGWSGEWDLALRAAMLRAPNRRYPVYWTTRSKTFGSGAQEIIDQRRAIVVEVDSADGFFSGVKQRVETLQQTHRKNPLSTELLVATAKRFVAKPEHRIQLDDLLSNEVERLVVLISAANLGAQGNWSQQEFRSRVQLYEAATEPVAQISGLLGRWGDDTEFNLVIDIIRALYAHAEKEGSGLVAWLGLRSYPTVLVFFAYSLGLVRAQRWHALHRLFATEIVRENGKSKRLIDVLYLWHWKGAEKDFWNNIEGLERRRTPLSDHLFEVFTSWSKSFAPLTTEFELLFSRFEMLAALADIEKFPEDDLRARLAGTNPVPMAVGRIGWSSSVRERLLTELQEAHFRKSLFEAGFGQQSVSFVDLFRTNLNRVGERWDW